MTYRRLTAAVMLSVALWVLVGHAAEAGGTSLIGGTVLSIDHNAASISVRMLQGEPRLFSVVDRSLFKDIKVGDHVTLELNDAGKIKKLMKLPVDPGN